MINKENYYSYSILKKRAKFEKGIYPTTLPTGAGKSTAIAFLYDDKGVNRLIVNISDNKKNIRQMYNQHKDICGKISDKLKEDFIKGSVFLHSKKDILLNITEDKDFQKNIYDFLMSSP